MREIVDLRMRVNTASMNKRVGVNLEFGAIAEVTYDLASEIPMKPSIDKCGSDGPFYQPSDESKLGLVPAIVL